MNKSKKEKKIAYLEIISSQSRQNQPECKSGIMKNIQSILRHSNNSNSSMQVSDMSYIQKLTIKDYARDLITKVKYYKQKSISLFQIQLSKYQSYYRQISDMIYEHYKQGKHKIEFESNRMIKIFEEWKERIELFTQEIQIKCHDYDYEDKLKLFQKYTRIEVDVIEIKFPELGSFKKALEKYLLSPKQMVKENKQNQQSFTNCLKKDEKLPHLPNKEKNQQTSHKSIQETVQFRPREISDEADDLLGCDEQLGAKSSADTIRRRKYDVGRQNVIKEEDESDDTNSIVSDS